MIKSYFQRNKLNILFSFAALVFMWLIWVAAYEIAGNELIVPSFSDTLKSFFGYFANKAFWTALFNSLWRTLVAFAVSFVLAIICAAAAIISKGARAFLKPVIALVRTLPTMAVILIILRLTSGNRALSPVIVTVLVLFPMIYSQICTSAEGIDGELAETAKLYATKRGRLFKIYIPLTAPDIVAQTGSDLSLGLKVMISAEVLANTAKGLGGMMQLENIAAEIANLAALTLSAVLAGIVTELIFSTVRKRAFKWSNSNI